MSYRPKYSLVTKISRINDINEGRSGWLGDPLFEAHYPVLSNIRCSTSNNTQTNFKTTGCIYQETQSNSNVRYHQSLSRDASQYVGSSVKSSPAVYQREHREHQQAAPAGVQGAGPANTGNSI